VNRSLLHVSVETVHLSFDMSLLIYVTDLRYRRNRGYQGASSDGVLLCVVYRSLLQVSIDIVHVSFDTSLLAHVTDFSYRRQKKLSRGFQSKRFILCRV